MIPLIVLGGLFLWAMRDKSSSSSSSSSDQDVDTTTGDPADDPTMYNIVNILHNNPVRRYAVTYGKPNTSLKSVGAVDLADAVSKATPPQIKSDSTLWIIQSYWANDSAAVQAYSANLAENATEEAEPTAGRSAKMEKVEVPVEEVEVFEIHTMYDPKTGEAYTAESIEDHNRMNKLGYTHDEPMIEVIEVQEVEIESAADQNNLFNGGVTETRLSSSNLKPSRFGGGY